MVKALLNLYVKDKEKNRIRLIHTLSRYQEGSIRGQRRSILHSRKITSKHSINFSGQSNPETLNAIILQI
jgi:hypothetical protein